MRGIVVLLVGVLVAACGAAPDKPLLANAPRPPQAQVAGVAAAAAAAITLANPDANRQPEKHQDVEKRAVEVRESVPPDVLDRLDQRQASQGTAPLPPESDSRQPTAAQQREPRPVLPSGRRLFDFSGTFSKPPTAGGL